MPGKWDVNFKRLLYANPEHFIRWFFPEAEFQGVIDAKSNNMEARLLETDGLFRIVLLGVACLIHIEFQTYYDKEMAKRTWKYNALASIVYGLPTWSVVIYIKPCKVAEPFYEERFPTGELIRHFRHRNIRLWELRPEDIEQLGLIGLYPLIVLTEGGSDPEVIEQVISRLEETGENTRKELLSLLYLLASFVIDEEATMQWLKRRFFEMHNELSETWVYQEILHEGVEKGQEMERRKGLERQRLMLIRFVQLRYPAIVELAKKKANSISHPEIIEEIYMRVSLANTQEEAMAILS